MAGTVMTAVSVPAKRSPATALMSIVALPVLALTLMGTVALDGPVRNCGYDISDETRQWRRLFHSRYNPMPFSTKEADSIA